MYVDSTIDLILDDENLAIVFANDKLIKNIKSSQNSPKNTLKNASSNESELV